MTNQTHPLISVVIATYNYARFLPEAVQSVKDQSYTNWECIIVDDCSSDNTAEVAAEMVSQDSRIRYVLNQKNLGEAGSRNVGNSLATGEFIAPLDGDDWWHPEKLQIQLEALQTSGNTVVCFSSAIMVSEADEGISQKLIRHRDQTALEKLEQNLRYGNLILHDAVLVRRDVITTVGGYDEHLPSAPDWDIWIRILDRYGEKAFVYVDTPLLYYRKHGSNISGNWRNMLRAERIIVRKMLLRRALCFRHPFVAWRIIDEHLDREVSRYKIAGQRCEAVLHAFIRVALSPIRRHRWLNALECFRLPDGY